MIGRIGRALHRKTKDEKGFTLIELIVVIAVLGILATLIIPRVTGVKDQADENTEKMNRKIIINALERYHAENDKYPEDLEELVSEGYLDEIPDGFKDEDFEDYLTGSD